MGKLFDILAAGGQSGDGFHNAWNSTTAAGDFEPLPPGWYVCRVESGELDTSRAGTPGYKLTFSVLEGPDPENSHAGRKLWHDLWLTTPAMPMAKRDLAKLGIDELQQLEKPLPAGIRCKVQVALRKGDDGVEHNRVKRFDVVDIDTPDADPDAPEEPGECRKGQATDGGRYSDNATYGYRIVGDCRNDRRLVDWPAAFTGYATCDPKADVKAEAYLSAFHLRR